MQMARCGDRADPKYKAIVGVLQQFIHRMVLDGNGTGLQEMPATTSSVEARVAELGGGIDGALTS